MMSCHTAFNRLRMLCLLFVLSAGFTEYAAGEEGNRVRLVRSEAGGITLEITTRGYDIHKGERATTVFAAGYGTVYDAGRPALPAVAVPVAVPFTGSLTAEVLESEKTVWRDIPLTPVSPEQAPGGLRDGLRPAPDRRVEVVRLGLLRGIPTASVVVRPFAYDADTRQLHVYERLLVRVRFHVPAPMREARPERRRPLGAFDRTAASVLLNSADAARWRTAPETSVLIRPSTPVSLHPECRILVKDDGIYRITYEQLLRAGVDVWAIDPRTFAVSNKGRAVAIRMEGETDGRFDEGDAIEFYGVGHRQTFQAQYPDMYRDPYTDINVYWLSWGGKPGPRMALEHGGLREADPSKYTAPVWYESTLHYEQDVFFDRLGGASAEMSDHWLWETINAGQTRTYSFRIPSPAPDASVPAVLRAMFYGRSTADAAPDHHLIIHALDGALTGHARWDGVAPFLARVAAPGATAHLRDTLEVTLHVPGDTPAGSHDFVGVNWFEIEYPRAYRAVDDQILFTKPKNGPPGLYQFTLDGFSNDRVQIYKIGVSELVRFVVTPGGDTGGRRVFRATFQTVVHDTETRFIALTPDRKRSPLAIERVDTQRDLAGPGMGADYVVITHDAFYDGVQRLADYRRQQGFTVETVRISEIYDRFNHGIVDPEAIRRFLQYAYTHWSPAPAYVLLVGDGSIDGSGPEENPIPVHLVNTVGFGAVGTDHRYALVSGDDLLPDLCIGRFPVRTVEELTTVIDKTIAYEARPEWGAWRRHLFLVSGDHRFEFETETETLIRQFVPPAYDVSRLSLHFIHATTPDFDTVSKQRLVTRLNEGVALLNYIGHGGGGTWSDRRIWEHADISRMTNGGRLPVIVSMTCFTGSFDGREEGLGERFLKTPDRGAVAFFGATGAGWLYNDFYMNQALFSTLFNRGVRETGGAFAGAKIAYLSLYGTGLQGARARSQVFQYLLLGDPALRIGFPPETLTLRADASTVLPGESIRIAGVIDGAGDGLADLALYREPDAPADDAVLTIPAIPVSRGMFSAQVTLPEAEGSGAVFVKAYYRSEGARRDAQGVLRIPVGRTVIRDVAVLPVSPGTGDSVAVSAAVPTRDRLDAVACLWSVDPGPWRRIPMTARPDDGHYQTRTPIPPQPAGATVRYAIAAVTAGGDTLRTPDRLYEVRAPVDLTIKPSGIFLDGLETVQLRARIHNAGGTAAASAPVRAWLHTPDGDRRLGDDRMVSLMPGDSAVVSWPVTLAGGAQRVSVAIDPERTLEEPDRANNRATQRVTVNRFALTPQAGLALDGAATASTPDGRGVFSVTPGFVTRPAVLIVTEEPAGTVAQQPDVLPVPQWQSGYRFMLTDSTALHDRSGHADDAPGQPPSLKLAFRHIPAEYPVFIYRWTPELGRWRRLDTTADSASVTAASAQPGRFGLFRNRDQTPPAIAMMAGDQPLTDGLVIPPFTTLSALIQDANGVDVISNGVYLEVDGEPVSSVDLVPAAPPNANAVPVSYLLPLTEGIHTVLMRAVDCNGNEGEAGPVRVVVEPDFDVMQVGSYPNPMEGYTVFTYRLTQTVDEFSLRIYTVDGRFVRAFSTSDATAAGDSGYHEIVWDGIDRRGRRVSNGVYFYRLDIQKGRRRIERTMKLAVVR